MLSRSVPDFQLLLRFDAAIEWDRPQFVRCSVSSRIGSAAGAVHAAHPVQQLPVASSADIRGFLGQRFNNGIMTESLGDSGPQGRPASYLHKACLNCRCGINFFVVSTLTTPSTTDVAKLFALPLLCVAITFVLMIIQGCDGERPICRRCRVQPPRSLTPCTYSHTPVGGGVSPQLEEVMESMQNRIHELEHQLELLSGQDPSKVFLREPYSNRSDQPLQEHLAPGESGFVFFQFPQF